MISGPTIASAGPQRAHEALRRPLGPLRQPRTRKRLFSDFLSTPTAFRIFRKAYKFFGQFDQSVNKSTILKKALIDSLADLTEGFRKG